MERHEQVTSILGRMEAGDGEAARDLLPLVYEELRGLAHAQMRRAGQGRTLQTTALVHEAYLRLAGSEERRGAAWESRDHFLAVAATAMRQVLASHARARRAAKRGGGAERVGLGEALDGADGLDLDLLGLHDALNRLERLDERQSRIVELRFFAGMTVGQIASVMNVSEPTVKRQWRAARAWLNAQLSGGSQA